MIEIRNAHIDLFTGLGGFSLAAQWAGFRTVVMCEIDEFRRAGLERAWPGVPILQDVRKIDGREWQGAAILTAGVPCQPASRAGKQRGKEDDRWLWGETIRVLSEARPAWALFENPPGIADVGFDGILAGVEAEGYETATVDIPACSVDSPQLRHRYWVVAHRKAERHAPADHPVCAGRDAIGSGDSEGGLVNPKSSGPQAAEQPELPCCAELATRPSDMADAKELLCDGGECHSGGQGESTRAIPEPGDCLGRLADTPRQQVGRTRQSWKGCWVPCGDGKWRRAKPGVCGLAHGVSRKLLAALGDSIVPEVAYRVLRAIRRADD